MAEVILTNWETGGNEEQALGDSGGVDYVHAQEFQIQVNASITKIEVWIKDGASVPTDAITVTIETEGDAGKPSGSLAHANATNTIPQSAIDGTLAWVECTFTPFDLAKDTNFYLRFELPAQSSNVKNHMLAQQPTPGYTYGNLCVSTDAGANWTAKTTHDLYFRVYGEAASPSVSPSLSPSLSPSPSASPSVSPSLSPSISISLSPSISPSNSPSVSPSVSLSLSPSVSPSVSVSVSPSVSLSLSPSVSESPSPSPVGENSLCVDLVQICFLIDFDSKYADTGNAFQGKYDTRSETYTTKYSDTSNTFTPKYPSKNRANCDD